MQNEVSCMFVYDLEIESTGLTDYLIYTISHFLSFGGRLLDPAECCLYSMTDTYNIHVEILNIGCIV